MNPLGGRPKPGCLTPVFGVRVIAEVAGLEGGEVVALMRAGYDDMVVSRVLAQRVGAHVEPGGGR